MSHADKLKGPRDKL